VTLPGSSATGYRTFGSVYSVGDDQIPYAIVDQSGANWEVGYGTYSATNTLRRDAIIANSAGTNVAINFSSGTQDVWVNLMGIGGKDLGRMSAMARGMALP